jgi:hypothetical protein
VTRGSLLARAQGIGQEIVAVKMIYVLLAAVVAAAAVGGIRSLAAPAPTVVDPTPDVAAPAPAVAAPRDSDDDPHAGLAPGATGADPHAHASESDVAVERLERAAGPNGRTVAEVLAQRVKLAGKPVRIHATVVKSTPGVLGKTWLHLRDGSGAEGTSDVTVTTDARPAVGDTVLLEGTVALDRDVGSGYRFPTLVENAQIVPPSR